MLKRYRNFLEKIFTKLTLHIMYFAAIGPTAIIAKLAGKKFLQHKIAKTENTNWQLKAKERLENNLAKMY